jgi:adenylosuccinate synthase
MSTLVIVGAQWGDEAKGKLVDVLGHQADFVVRYSGGNNAGHTVIVGGEEFKFQLLPAGILHPGCTSILGGGMVICPKHLLDEIDRTRAQRAELGRLVVSPAAHVVFPYHRLLDQLEEEARGANKIGTTSRGIGPAYTDKVARVGIRIGEFVQPEVFRRRLAEVLAVKNRLLRIFDHPEIEFDDLHDEYAAYAERIRPYVGDAEGLLQDAVEAGQRILFEGAQGTFLDLDYGTYPYVTSSHPTAGGACLGTGLGPRHIHHVLGVAKAYATRVGEGPFPTELHDALGEQIRRQGNEYGTVTGRARRCGWLDLVALRYSARLNSLSGLVLTRLDTLRGIPELKVAVGYSINGEVTKRMPARIEEWASASPVYETLEGWDVDVSGVRQIEDLPAAVRRYVAFIEEYVGVPAAVLSVGPDRAETIMVRSDLVWGP